MHVWEMSKLFLEKDPISHRYRARTYVCLALPTKVIVRTQLQKLLIIRNAVPSAMIVSLVRRMCNLS